MKAITPRSSLVLGLLVLALVSVPALRADEAVPAAKKEKGPSKADLKKYDANGDGQLDESELAKKRADEKAKRDTQRAEDLARYDENHDGKLNKGEKEKIKADKQTEHNARKTAKEAEKESK
ncbi:MAG TPA: hypothetical protein VFJ90_04860 [Candidatus Didemnitutus sp.]|nr:hypothetical protein [Candidatus Didemnitutus sp.]